MAWLLKFIFDSFAGRAVFGGLVALGLFIGFMKQQRDIGRWKAGTEIKENNDAVQAQADAAAAKSRDPGTRGLLNPYYRNRRGQ